MWNHTHTKNFDRKTSSCPDSICIISNVRGRYCRKYCTHHNSITQEYCTTNFVSVNQSFYFDAKIRSALQSSDRSHLSNIFSRNNQAKSNPRKWGGGWGSNFKLNKDVISRFGILKLEKKMVWTKKSCKPEWQKFSTFLV